MKSKINGKKNKNQKAKIEIWNKKTMCEKKKKWKEIKNKCEKK